MSIQKLREAMQKAERICVFTGAGISCPSGIPDFRSAKGLYSETDKSGYAPEEIISHSFFVKHTDLFYEFYKSKMMYPEAEPNKAHLYFAQLEKQGKKVSVVTQNIDGLHTKARCTDVYELHGSVHRNFCLDCGSFFDGDYVYKSADVPKCEKCGGTVKPDVVLYEEGLDGDTIEKSIQAIRRADLLIVAGTSLTVYPAASFVNYYQGNRLVLINRDATPYDKYADLVFHESLGDVLSKL